MRTALVCLVVGLAWGLLAFGAWSHDGFETLKQRGLDCCGGEDCRQIPGEWITLMPEAGGARLVVPAGAWPEKFPADYFPDGITLNWTGEPGLSPDGTNIACVVAVLGGEMMVPGGSETYTVKPGGVLRCLYIGGVM